MVRIITYALAVVGLVVVLSHPLAKKGLGAVRGLYDNMGATLTKAADKRGGAETGISASAAPLTAEELAALLPKDDIETEGVAEMAPDAGADKDEAVKEPVSPEDAAQDAAGAELVKVLEIYKNAEKDSDNSD